MAPFWLTVASDAVFLDRPVVIALMLFLLFNGGLELYSLQAITWNLTIDSEIRILKTDKYFVWVLLWFLKSMF